MTDDFMKQWEANKKALKGANVTNKEAVFDALVAAKITRIEVEFDGEGDSGGLTGTVAYDSDSVVGLPPTDVKMIIVETYGSGSEDGTRKLEDAIEILCFDYIGQEGHGSWENNEGPYGTFQFDVAERSVALSFHARVEEVVTSTYEF
jgi:hypothetical protein